MHARNRKGKLTYKRLQRRQQQRIDTLVKRLIQRKYKHIIKRHPVQSEILYSSNENYTLRGCLGARNRLNL